MRPLKPLVLTPLLLCAFEPSTSLATTVMHDAGVSTTGFVSASQLITSNVSLTTGPTTWGYISSTGTYLPNLATNRISTTSISTTNLTTEALTVTGTPTANTDATTKAYVDTVIAANCTGTSSGNNTCQVGRTWKPLGSYGTSSISPLFIDNSNTIFTYGSPSSSYYSVYKNGTAGNSIYAYYGFGFWPSASGQKIIAYGIQSGTSYYVYYSANGGGNWTDVSNALTTSAGSSGVPYNVDKVTISGDGSRLYVSAQPTSSGNYRLLTSTNAGTTWTTLVSSSWSSYIPKIQQINSDGTRLFAALSGYSYSTNGGNTWASLGSNLTASSPDVTKFIRIITVGPSACAPSYSLDGGSTWTTAMDVYDNAVCSVNADSLGISNDGSIMYAGNYYSFNSGNTWTKETTTRLGKISPVSGKFYFAYSGNVQLSECP